MLIFLAVLIGLYGILYFSLAPHGPVAESEESGFAPDGVPVLRSGLFSNLLFNAQRFIMYG